MTEVDDDFSSTVVLTDETGRTLDCFIEQTLTADDREYWLLMPVDAPIEIFGWEADGETLIDIEDEAVERLFPTAKAVLAELNLTLQRSAYTLTAIGELPEAEEENCFTLEIDEEDGVEPTADSFQVLATFYHEDQQYSICTPLDPLLFFAKCDLTETPLSDQTSKAVLLSPEEFKKVQPYLEDQLFDELE